MPNGQGQAPPGPDLPTLKVWAEYGKDRFNSVDARIGEYRGAARQLIAAVGVVIGLEVTILVRLALDEKSPIPFTLRLLVLALFVVILVFQFHLLHGLLGVGYKSEPIVGPESPRVLAPYFAQADEAEAHRLTGAYYARAHENFYELSERLGKSLANATSRFQQTLLALLVGVTVMSFGGLWPLLTSGRGTPMGDKATSTRTNPPSETPASSPPAPAASPPQAPATTKPLLDTPTNGQLLRKSEQGGRVLRDEK